MQQVQIINGIKNPLVIKNNTEDLNFVLNQFPYCQTVQLLYAQNLKLNNAILFEQQLKKAAVYCTDRHQLFNQLNMFFEVEKIIKDNVVDNNASTETKIETEKPKFQQLEQPIKTEQKEEIEIFEKDYISQAISSSILLETSNYELLNEEIDEINAIKPNTANQKEDDDFNDKTPHTFNDWINYFNKEKITSSSKQEKNKEEIPKNSVAKIDLIDKFIQENPKIQPKKTEFYSPVNMARLSVVDDYEIVSETLALIHVNQGNYQKAISMYEKLSLKNPKKRSYFAIQIKNLTQKLK